MFKLRIADYINQNMLERGLTYKDVARISGVSDSSIHTYATAKVNNPSEDNLIRIAAAFGDPPEVIQQMRRESIESTEDENKIIARSDDKERIEQLATLISSNVAQILEEFCIQSAAQHSAETASIREQTSEKIEMLRERACIIADERKKNCAECKNTHIKTTAYLKSTIRYLAIALIVMCIFAVVGLSILGGYAFYAYQTFDRNDPTQGLYQ